MNRNLLVLVLMFVAGCATPREMFDQGGHGYKPGLDKAAFDLDCTKEELKVVELGYYEFGVKGCGKKATYKFETYAGGWYRVDQPQ